MTVFGLIDLSNLFHRARHGAQADADGKLGLAMHLVFRSLRKIVRDRAVEHIVFALDQGSWRSKVYPNYKLRRRLARLDASPQEQAENAAFFEALDKLSDFLTHETRCTVLRAPQIEGDDFIARWIAQHPHDQHIIVSGDSDFVQLLAPNVRIYDALNQRTLSLDGIVADDGSTLAFTVSAKDGKIKVLRPSQEFQPEPDWSRKALFIKLIRGDTSDSVFAAYPGVRRTKIAAAWDDRRQQGYDWNNLMFQSWDKLTGTTADGQPLTERVRVIDEYRINESVIDLGRQPPEICAQMDQVIRDAINKTPRRHVGMAFLQFCTVFDLPILAREAADHVSYLNAPYRRA